jgi:hypothetical protein
MNTDLLEFPTIEAPPPPVAPPVPAPAAPPASSAVATITPSIKDTVLAQFKAVEPDLKALADKYRDVAYAVSTTKGMAEAKAARADLRDNGRLKLTKTEKAVKADVNDLKRVMADEVDRLVAIVQPVEEAIDTQIKAEEERKAREKAERERIEAERIAGHQERMAKIEGYLTHCQQYGMTSARIQVGIDKLAAATFGPEWQEFAVPAADLQCRTLEAMRALHAQAVEREAEALRLEEQRQEQARVAAEQAETQRKLDEAKRQLDEAAVALAKQQEDARVAAAERKAWVDGAIPAAAIAAGLVNPPPEALAVPPTPPADPAPVVLSDATISNPPFAASQLQPGNVEVLGPPAVVVPAVPVRELTDLERCRMALADACDLLEGWIVSKCPKKHTAEHFAHVAKLRDMGGLPRNTPTTN